jgi:hypothetical protein
MSMRLDIHSRADLLEVEATGEFSLEEAQRTFLAMMEAVTFHKTNRVLFDGRSITGNPSTIERFYFGEFAAATAEQYKLQGKCGATRFSFVLKEPVLDPEKFGETVAVNRGMCVKAFDNPEEALAWLENSGNDK